MAINKSVEGGTVNLTEILEARDKRVLAIADMQKKYNCSVISFTLNIPGPIKRNGLTLKSFEVGRKEISDMLSREIAEILDYVYTDAPTGTEAVWGVNANAHKLKKAMALIEEGHFLGRLFDIDVIGQNGEKILREEVGQEERRCFICGKPGMGCARSRAHSLEELTSFTFSLTERFFKKQYVKNIAQTAVKSLLYEVCITPKPGLVDRANSGAHKDMDIFTFVDSACALSDYFEEITAIAMENNDIAPSELLNKIRFEGMMAEAGMFEATKGINTHKGIIFSLGILCAAYGYIYESDCKDTNEVLSICAKMAMPALDKDFEKGEISTNGEALYAQYKIKGVRGEAASGFNSVRKYALPVLEKCIEDGLNINDAGAIALLNLVANVEDTNVISRSSLEIQKKIQAEVKLLLEQEHNAEELIVKAARLDEEFIKLNISPGGCADLLAIALMLYFINNREVLGK